MVTGAAETYKKYNLTATTRYCNCITPLFLLIIVLLAAVRILDGFRWQDQITWYSTSRGRTKIADHLLTYSHLFPSMKFVFYSTISVVLPQWSDYEQAKIDLDNGWVPMKPATIIWGNAGRDYKRIYASLGSLNEVLNVLTKTKMAYM